MEKDSLKQNKLVSKDICSGCSACFNVCPVGAISMKKDSAGFLSPEIDYNKCINCGKCTQVCPAQNPISKVNQYPLPKVYAGWNKSSEVRRRSSSGGIFSILAEDILKKSGYICGASFNKENKVKHIIISSKKELRRLRGSKYVQSEIGDSFKKIRALLEQGNWVLFSGTPCQAVGLRNYLGKEYDKLLVVDIICHGVPSPYVFDKYLKETEEKNNKKIAKVNFRDQSLGWRNPQFVLATEKDSKLVKKVLYDDVYGRGFLTNLILRNSCTNCIYSRWPKSSDITLGDFWGIWLHDPKLDDNLGTSMIMINNSKGESFINSIKGEMSGFTAVPSRVAVDNNYPVLISSDKHVNTNAFFKELSKDKGSVSELILKHLDDDSYGTSRGNKCVGILNFSYENYNFGANLIAYSMLRVLRKLGYDAKVINYNPFPDQAVTDKAASLSFYKFRQDFLEMTKICRSEEDLIKLNKQFDVFITGSDQVWRQLITGGNALHYFLDFVFKSKKRISYGASFGHDYWDGDKDTTTKAKDLLAEFDAISVREKDGLDILSDRFGITDATCVLDPTLLLDQEDYDELTRASDISTTNRDHMAFYFIFDDDGKVEHGEKMREISKWTGFDVVNIKGKEGIVAGEKRFVYDSMPNFLDNIKKSSFVITDSYHGVIFSIIYKKDFLCIGKKSKSLSRFENLFSLLKIDVNGRFLSSINEVDKKIFSNRIDYNKVYEILDSEKKKSLKYLVDSLKIARSSDDKIRILEHELTLSKIDMLATGNRNIILQNENQTLVNENQLLQSDNQVLRNEASQLQNEKEQLSSRKSIRYADMIGRFLRRIGIKQ